MPRLATSKSPDIAADRLCRWKRFPPRADGTDKWDAGGREVIIIM